MGSVRILGTAILPVIKIASREIAAKFPLFAEDGSVAIASEA